MTDLTREQIENIVLHYFGREGDQRADGLTISDVRALCNMALRSPAVPEECVVVPGYKSLVDKCVSVLQSHIVPDGISDKDALSELYGILDGPEYRAVLHPYEGEWVLYERYLRAVKERDEALGRVAELEGFNVGLASESERLREGLRFYAHGMHVAGFETWEGPSGDENWLCPPSKDMGLPSMREDYDKFIETLDEHMIEDGGIAQVCLSGKRVDWEGEPPKEHPCEPAMKEIAAAIAAARRGDES